MSLHENKKIRQNSSKKLFSPILVFTFLLILVLFAIINFFAFWGVNANLKKNITEELESHSRIVSNAVSQFFVGKLHTILLLNQYQPILDLLKQCHDSKKVAENPNCPAVVAMLRSVDVMYDQLDRIYNAKNRTSSDEAMWLASVPGNFLLTAAILMDPDSIDEEGVPDPWVTKERPWYPYISETRDVVFTDTYMDIQFRVPVVSIVKTVRRESDEILGVIGFDVFLPAVGIIMEETQTNKSGMSLLIDGHDLVIYHPHREFSMDNRLQNLGNGYDSITQEIGATDLKPGNSHSFLTEIEDVPSYVSFTKVAMPNARWYVVNIIPQSDAEQAVNSYFYRFVIVGLVDLFLFLVPIVLFFILEQQKRKTVLKINKELVLAQEVAEQASRSKSEFLATISHEMRTPLNGVIGLSDLLLGTELKTKQNEYALLIRESGRSLLFLINDILDFSKIEAGKLELENEEFNIRATLASVFGILASRANEKQLELCSTTGTNVPIAVLSDEGRIRQVLLNLVGNALKFTENGGVTVELKADCLSDSLYQFHFRVMDSGIGIPAEKLDRLFLSFSQVDASSSRKYGGTGLGLAISKALVQLMGGTIGVESKLGEGSIFWFSLPLRIPEPGNKTTIINIGNNKVRTGQITDLLNKRVLVVDDNVVHRSALVKQMNEWNMNVQGYSNSRETLDALRQAADQNQPIDLAVIDNTLEDTSGYELVNAILDDERLNQTVMILLMPLDVTEKELGISENLRDTLFSLRVQTLGKPVFSSALFDAMISILFHEMSFSDTPTPSPEHDSGIHIITLAGERRPRILIAEDNRINQMVVKEILAKFEMDSEIVDNGLKACEAVESQEFDLVLMDCQMPEMDGFEATQRIREWEKTNNVTRGIPIVALTANATQGDEQLCLDSGMDAYCSKPINPKLLFKTLRCWLSEK